MTRLHLLLPTRHTRSSSLAAMVKLSLLLGSCSIGLKGLEVGYCSQCLRPFSHILLLLRLLVLTSGDGCCCSQWWRRTTRGSVAARQSAALLVLLWCLLLAVVPPLVLPSRLPLLPRLEVGVATVLIVRAPFVRCLLRKIFCGQSWPLFYRIRIQSYHRGSKKVSDWKGT